MHRLKVVPESKLINAQSDHRSQSVQFNELFTNFSQYIQQSKTIEQRGAPLSLTRNPASPYHTFSVAQIGLPVIAVNPSSKSIVPVPTVISSKASSIAQLSSRIVPFKCPLCNLIYQTQTFLNEHLRKEHSVLI